MNRNEDQKPWSFRRKLIITTLCFDAAVIIIALLRHIPESVAETAIASAFYSGMALIGSYVFGAVWDDKGKP